MVWLDDAKLDFIESQIINKVLLPTNKSCPKNSILEIVTSLLIEVFLVDFDKKFPTLKKNVSGMVDYNLGASKPKIYLDTI